jgi:S-adenosylmethionine hydrolase
VRHAAFFLASAVPYFPPGTIHVVVVDPGVGTDRAILYVEAGGQRLLVPDNGCWTLLAGESPRVIRLAQPRFWRQPVSATFHGRDVFAPVAAHLSLGTDPALLGHAVGEWVRLPVAPPRPVGDGIVGEIAFIDDFGNIITNIRAEWPRPPDVLSLGGVSFRRGADFRWVRSYGEAPAGALVALVSSVGLFEVAVARGSAAERLKVRAGDAVTVGWAR